MTVPTEPMQGRVCLTCGRVLNLSTHICWLQVRPAVKAPEHPADHYPRPEEPRPGPPLDPSDDEAIQDGDWWS
jgi:hypothetical protein